MGTALLTAIVAAVLGAGLGFWLARTAAAPRGGSRPDVERELLRIAEAQEGLRRDVQQGREASVVGLRETTRELHGEIAHAQRTLVELRALEQGRTRQLDRAADSLRRLEAVVAGSHSRGEAGESILARALGQLPPDLVEVDVPFEGKVVEYALRLPGGRLLPVDSKWTSARSLERLADAEDPAERLRHREQIARELRSRARELGKYLDPERTLAMGVLAVPDAAYAAVPEVLADGYRDGVLIVPYSQALPYVLAVYRLAVRFGVSVDQDQLGARLRDLDRALGRLEDELEGRLARGLAQVGNACDALRDEAHGARRLTARLLRESEALVLGEEAPVGQPATRPR